MKAYFSSYIQRTLHDEDHLIIEIDSSWAPQLKERINHTLQFEAETLPPGIREDLKRLAANCEKLTK